MSIFTFSHRAVTVWSEVTFSHLPSQTSCSLPLDASGGTALSPFFTVWVRLPETSSPPLRSKVTVYSGTLSAPQPASSAVISARARVTAASFLYLIMTVLPSVLWHKL